MYWRATEVMFLVYSKNSFLNIYEWRVLEAFARFNELFGGEIFYVFVLDVRFVDRKWRG
jgi:hypothetical protein